MRSLTAALESIIAADVSRPVTTVTITLKDAGSTVLYLADQDVTISAQPYTSALVEPPQLVVTGDEGIDHTRVRLSNADWIYSSYDNVSDFDGASATIEQWYATDAAYTTFEGPVLAFSGLVYAPASMSDGTLLLNIMADGRVSGRGGIGRTITAKCMNDFGDTICGYSYSGTITTGGTYTAGNNIALTEAPTTEQGNLIVGAAAKGPVAASNGELDTVKIVRGSTPIYTGLAITARNYPGSGSVTIQLGTTVTVQAGDKIVYESCPRNSVDSCARRWQLGSATRQQDSYLGFDYWRDTFASYGLEKQGVLARFQDIMDQVVPLCYGTPWSEPLLFGVHAPYFEGTDGWASWQTSSKGPFVVGLIGEGVVDAGIESPALDIILDNAILESTSYYKDKAPSSYISISTGTTAQGVSDLAPLYKKDITGLPGLSAFPTVAYFILDLPDNYDLTASPQFTTRVNKFWVEDSLKTVPIRKVNNYEVKKPPLRVKMKGRKVYTWSMVVDTPTKSGATAHTRNPFWQVLDLLTASDRTTAGSQFSASLDPDNDIDLESFILWAAYADETIQSRNSDYEIINDQTRFETDLYDHEGDREKTLRSLLRAARASLVFKNGKIGVVCDAPLGGKGAATGATTTTLTDANRSDTSQRDIPTWPADALIGYKVEMLTGAAAGDIRTITDNDGDSVTVDSAWSTTPSSGDTYAIYAQHLTTDNCDEIRLERFRASHELTNRVVASFRSAEKNGIPATVPIEDTDHIQDFGPNEENVEFPAISSWQGAVRTAWYEMRRGLDTNRKVVIRGANIESLPLEVGDVVLVSHDVSGINKETFRIERIEADGQAYAITARLYREHIYADWPIAVVDGIEVSSDLPSPNAIPANVTNISGSLVYEQGATIPTVKMSYDVPGWPYNGWSVEIESRYFDWQTNDWTAWEKVGESVTASASFLPTMLGTIEYRAVFLSQSRVRADSAHIFGDVSSATSGTLTDSTQSWETDIWAGGTVEITAGVGVGETQEVSSNDGDTLTLSGSWTATPDATSDYKIYFDAPVVTHDIDPGLDFDFTLDEDNGNLYIFPRFDDRIVSYKWLTDSTDEPLESEVDTTGSLETTAGVLVHTFAGTGAERVYVGAIGYSTIGGDTNEPKSSLVVKPYTFRPGDDGPDLFWERWETGVADTEGIRLIARDDSDSVAIYYRTYLATDTPPVFTRVPVTPGTYDSDPLIQNVSITKPAEGATSWYLEAYAVDGNETRHAEHNLLLEIDGNARPSGSFTIEIDETTGDWWVIPSSNDSDSGSYRFAVNIEDLGHSNPTPFPSISGAGTEQAGDTFGVRVSQTAFTVKKVAYVTGKFYRTTTPSWLGYQDSSIASEEYRVTAALPIKIYPANIDSLNLTWDDDQIIARATAGQGTQSISFEFDDDPAFGSPLGSTVTNNVTEGNTTQATSNSVPLADTGKSWYCRAKAYTGTGGTGDLGITMIQEIHVPQQYPEMTPMVDIDGVKAYLHPNYNTYANAFKYLVRTNGITPTKSDVMSSGTEANPDPDSVTETDRYEEIHTFSVNGESIIIGIVAYYDPDGGTPPWDADETAGEFYVKRAMFTLDDVKPELVWFPYDTDDPATTGVRLVATDDSDSVAIYYRAYQDGGTVPGWSRNPDPTGYAADPLKQDVEVSVPNTGENDYLVEAYAVDADGNRHADKNLVIRIDPSTGGRPGGFFKIDVDTSDGEVRVYANPIGPNTGSYRFKVSESAEGADSYPSFGANFSDVDPNEYSGSATGGDFGAGQLLSGITLRKGRQINLVGYFFRVDSAVATDQDVSPQSEYIQMVARFGDSDRGVWIVPGGYEWTWDWDAYEGTVDIDYSVGDGAESVQVEVSTLDTSGTPSSDYYYFDVTPGTQGSHRLGTGASVTSPSAGDYVADGTTAQVVVFLTPMDADAGAGNAGDTVRLTPTLPSPNHVSLDTAWWELDPTNEQGTVAVSYEVGPDTSSLRIYQRWDFTTGSVWEYYYVNVTPGTSGTFTAQQGAASKPGTWAAGTGDRVFDLPNSVPVIIYAFPCDAANGTGTVGEKDTIKVDKDGFKQKVKLVHTGTGGTAYSGDNIRLRPMFSVTQDSSQPLLGMQPPQSNQNSNTPTLDCQDGTIFEVTPTAALTIPNPTNLNTGETIFVLINSGYSSVAYGTDWQFPGGESSLTHTGKCLVSGIKVSTNVIIASVLSEISA